MDKEALTKILSNLFNNAVKYAQSNIIAQLDIQPESNPNMFMITVSNDGTLIPKDMEEDIFKPFVQIKNTDNGQRTAGTGIGLPLVITQRQVIPKKRGSNMLLCRIAYYAGKRNPAKQALH